VPDGIPAKRTPKPETESGSDDLRGKALSSGK